MFIPPPPIQFHILKHVLSGVNIWLSSSPSAVPVLYLLSVMLSYCSSDLELITASVLATSHPVRGKNVTGEVKCCQKIREKGTLL